MIFRLIAILLLFIACSGQGARSQTSISANNGPSKSWNGRRIVMLKGFGEYYVETADGKTKIVNPDGLSVNIVAVVQRVEGMRIWIEGNGYGSEPVGWINTGDTILLEDAIAYFNSIIERDPRTGMRISGARKRNTL